MATVVPRVIPLFLHDLGTSGRRLQCLHLEAFAASMPKVYRAKVEPSDTVDLIVALLALLQPRHPPDALSPADAVAAPADNASLAVADPAATAAVDPEEERVRAHALRVLVSLFDDGTAHAPSAYRALRSLARRVQAAAEAAAAEEFHRFDDTAATDANNNNNNADGTLAGVSPVKREPAPAASPNADATTASAPVTAAVHMDHLLSGAGDSARAAVLGLWRKWDAALIDVSCFTSSPKTLHAHLPGRLATKAKVYRDFLTCTQRPKLERGWGSYCCVHIKTNIKARSDIMFRFLVEGYNYGVNAAIHSDAVGCTNRRWADIGKMTDYGWPEGWDADMCNDYAPGAVLSQYYSADGWLTLRLKAKSFFSVGFGVSAWLVTHGYGEGFVVAGEIFHQDDDL